MERLEAKVYGRVQGVMFRDFACRKARNLKLLGSVRNLPDGTVEVIAEGERAKLERLLQKLQNGPLLARVTRIEHAFKAPSGEFRAFAICFD